MYYSISFTHKNTDLALREKLSFSQDEKKKEFLKVLKTNENIEECLLISTCNRVELLCFVKNFCAEFIINSLAIFCNVNKEELFKKADIFEDKGAIHHLFAVASSLDSLVIGETQIVGQLKNAFNFALKNGFCSLKLSLALKFALKCAALIRTNTEISKNPISVASVAVTKAKEIFDLSTKKAVIIGAGEMAELAARHLLAAKAGVVILNRNLQNAKKLCDDLGSLASYDSLENLKEYLNNYELFFSATNAQECIITNDLIKDVDFKRYFFDIAVPRDIDLRQSEKIIVFAVDDLKIVVEKNLALREQEARIAYGIISSKIEEFYKFLSEQALNPIIKALRLKAKECANTQLEIALKKGYLKKSDEQEARKLIHQVFKAFLHTPTINLKNSHTTHQSEAVLNALSYAFELKFQNDINELNLENDNEI